MLSLCRYLLNYKRKEKHISYQRLLDVFLYKNHPIARITNYKKELLKVLAQNSYRYMKVNDLLCVVLKENEKDIPISKLKKRLKTLLNKLENDLLDILGTITNTVFLYQQNQHDRRLKEIKLSIKVIVEK